MISNQSMSAVHNSVETVNAAATAIITAESRVQPPTHRKKKWASLLSLYWCFNFKYENHCKKINHSALAPEPIIPILPSTAEPLTRPTARLLPFTVPPSSPALQSDPPSATQTPGGPLSANPHSPPVPTNPIFATGPYAHETQLVSPPVFSTFTTEPSSASFTPPVDSVHCTRPSSPEVPFAKKLLLSQYNFQPYQEYQGSPISNLISPGSVVSNSGTSSPYLDKNYSLKFYIGEVPKILASENFSIRKWGSRLDSGALTPEVLANSDNEVITNHRVSFELNHEDIAGGVENDSVSKRTEEEENPTKYRSISFGSAKDFNFDNLKGEFSGKTEWWANEKIIGEDLDSQNNWTFFPLLKSGAI